MSTGAEDRPGSLAAAILDLEAERRAASEEHEEVSLDALPGVGHEKMAIKDAFRLGGTYTFVTLCVLAALDNIENATLGVLAPDIRDGLHISSGLMVFITAASSSFLILGSLPMGLLADRFPRGRIIAGATALLSVMISLSGLAVNALMLFVTRMFVGVGKSNQYVVHASLMADQYPIKTRGRLSSLLSLAGNAASTVSPLLVGGLAVLIGGPSSWRWVFVLLGIPVMFGAVMAVRLPEPPRGQYEKRDVVGEVIEDEDPLPISMEAASARLLQVRTLRTVLMGFSALGFSIFTVPVLSNLFLEDRYGLGSFGRGAVATVSGVCVLISVPFVGRFYDRVYHEDPARALRLVGLLILPSAILVPIQYFMPTPALFAVLAIPSAVLSMSAYAMVGPLTISVVPYRLRGIGSAMSALYVFFIGATGGALLAALLSNAYGPRTAVIVIAVPATLVGGFLMIRGSMFIRSDLAMVAAEIREELDEHDRRQADPERVPALQVNHVDFSYGPVQILFDVSFEVKNGEVLALLGTNGAGKSTALRVIAGLGTPSRGVVRHHGRSILYVSPEMRTRLGIAMLPGGKGVFNDMSIHANLEMAAYNQRKDPAGMKASIDRALGLFPELAERPNELASALSGGQQQLLALARILVNEPDILMIDELSLGLAPIMVERLVKMVGDLKAKGMTIIIVEQSLNVAMAVADRAVFLEKGHVRFEGDMTELIERDDLARAVFLGAEGG